VNTATAPRSGFVTTMALLSLALAGLGVAGNLLQALAALAMPSGADLAALLPPGVPLPPLLDWLDRHLLALSLAGVLGSALLGWVSWGLLRRRDWGRRGFIALLLLAALGNFAGLPLLDRAFDGLAPALAQLQDLDGGDLQAMLAALQRTLFWGSLAGALAIAAVHGWIAWQLSRPQIRAEFD
jgi:hypothetical protein